MSEVGGKLSLWIRDVRTGRGLDNGNPLIVEKVSEIFHIIENDMVNMDIGDVFTISKKKMDKEKFEDLPEHGGW